MSINSQVRQGNGLMLIEKVKSLFKFLREWMREVFPGQPFEQFEAVKVVGDSMPPPLRS
jgi:hypothetical protein